MLVVVMVDMGNRSGMMIHSDIDPYGTLGCLGVDLGGKPGTRSRARFLKGVEYGKS